MPFQGIDRYNRRCKARAGCSIDEQCTALASPASATWLTRQRWRGVPSGWGRPSGWRADKLGFRALCFDPTSLVLLLQCAAPSSIGEACSFASPAYSRRLLAQHTITSKLGTPMFTKRLPDHTWRIVRAPSSLARACQPSNGRAAAGSYGCRRNRSKGTHAQRTHEQRSSS